MSKVKKPRYITAKEIMKNAKPCSLIKDVYEEIVREMNSPERQEQERKRLAGIAEIMNKVVGAEGE